MPVVSPRGTDSSRPSRKPTTSTGTTTPSRRRTSQTSPMHALGPFDSTTSPTLRVTRPMRGAGSESLTRSKYGSSLSSSATASRGNKGLRGAECIGAFVAAKENRGQFLHLGIDADVDEAEVGLDQASAAANDGIRDDLNDAGRIGGLWGARASIRLD